jgi:hypothetical protein
MKLKFEDLSIELQRLLTHVKDSQTTEGGHYDKRGYYAEYDSFDCKPWTHKVALEAQECPFVELHKDSDLAWELERDSDSYCPWSNWDEEEEEEFENEEECHGVLFVNIKKEYLDLIPDEVIPFD